MYKDKLPGSLLSDAQWNMLLSLAETEPKPYSLQSKKRIKSICSAISQGFTGENKEKCVICGGAGESGLCDKCYKAIFSRNTLRYCGNTHDMPNSSLVCRVCYSRPAVTKGICRRCFFLSQYHNIYDIEKLRKFVENRKIYGKTYRKRKK